MDPVQVATETMDQFPIEKLIWPALTLLQNSRYTFAGKKRTFTLSHQYDKFLTNQVLNANSPQTYYASIGEGDWVSCWLNRLCETDLTAGIKMPKIDRIIIKHLNTEFAAQLEKHNLLSPGFSKRMQNNLASIREAEHKLNYNVDVSIRDWGQTFPRFHGHAIGNWTLVGLWAVDSSGFFHVKTPVQVYHKSVDPSHFNRIIRWFE
jgi:hypothetical protein